MNNGHLIIWAVCLVAGVIIGSLFKGCSNKPIEPAKPVEIHDTIAIHDTAYIAGKTKVLYVTKTDTAIVRDTDTIRIEIPIEHKEYRDTFVTDSSRTELAVRFSGYDAKIDGIELTQDWTIQPRTIEKKRGWRWCVMPSVQVGYGASVVGQQVFAAPYVGVGVAVGYGYTFKK